MGNALVCQSDVFSLIRVTDEYQIVHHPADGSEPPWTESWLECIEETEFRIGIAKAGDLPHEQDVDITCWIDGREVDGRSLVGLSDRSTISSMFKKSSEGIYRSPLRFAAQHTTDDTAEVSVPPEFMEDMGNMVLSLRLGEYRESSPVFPEIFTRADVGVLQESADHKCGERIQLEQSMPMWTFTQRDKTNYYIFTWRYRSRPRLIGLKIIDEPKPMLHLPPSRPLIRQPQPSSPLSSSSSDWHISSGDGTSAAVIEAQKKHIERLMAKNKKLKEKAKKAELSGGDVRATEPVDLAMDDELFLRRRGEHNLPGRQHAKTRYMHSEIIRK